MARAKFDYTGLLKHVRELESVQSKLPLLQKRLSSRLRRRIPVQARRDIQTEYNLKAGRINKGLSVREVSSGIELVGASRGIGLVNFSASYRGRKAPGVSVSVTKKKGRVTIPRTFIPKNKNPNQVFIRRELLTGSGKIRRIGEASVKVPLRGNTRGSSPTSTLVRLYGPSIAQMLKKEDRVQRMSEFAQSVIEQETLRLLGR